jgi:hypothetical protein
MRLTKKQERVIENGRPVRLRKDGLDCVVVRADLYDRVATLFEIDNPLMQGIKEHDVGGDFRGGREGPTGDPSERWTEEKNDRRCELIDKDIEGTIAESEKLELERLQERFHKYLDTVAPPPMEGARRLHQQLLDKKRQRERAGVRTDGAV